MPELPEVETVRRGLVPVMEGGRIARVTLRRATLRFPFPDRFAERLEGACIERLTRRAKYLLAALSTGETLIMHLGMSGRFVVEMAASGEDLAEDGLAPGRFHNQIRRLVTHDHVIFHLRPAAGDTLYNVIYNDPRRFGFMDLVPPGETSRHLAALGREPLDPGLDGPNLRALFAGRRAPLKAALLDQRLIAGLGNIYVCEALHRAKLAPERAAGSLGAREATGLANVIRAVLEEAIAAGGSTLRDHAQVDGELGYFQHAFRVYDRAGEPCPTPGCSGLVRRAVHSGRSTFFCALCQR